MNIIDDIFKKSRVIINELENYGFSKCGEEYIYSKKILDNNFEVVVSVNKDSKVNAKIIDLEMNEEYIAHLNINNNGSFVNSVRDEYTKLLNDINDKCFVSNYYVFSQSNRITKYIINKYKDKPEFLWEKYPGIGVFRNSKSQKWYAAIMNIDKSKITNGSGEIEIIDIKLKEDMISSLLSEKNYYEAYHMNKKNWITIILDDSISDEVIFSLIDISYSLVDSSSTNSLNTYVVPANPKIYDITNYNVNDIIEWKQNSKINIDDNVYIYLGSPYSSLIYYGKVIDKDIPFYYESEHLKMTKVMKLRILKKFEKDEYPLNKLKTFGLTSIRSMRKIPKKLEEELLGK